MSDGSFENAFDDLFGATFRLAYRILGDRQAAEDVAAEACARVWVRWGRLRDDRSRRAWLFRVASNLAIDLTRRRKRFLRASPARSVEDDVTLRISLGAELRQLPRRQREAVVLRYLAGMPEREVADELGISVGTVKTHASRGLAALRTELADLEEVDLGAGTG